jgi:protoheme IX farnesyltransferase
MMKTAATAEVEVAPVESFAPSVALEAPAVVAAAPAKFADYLELTKPRIAVMALFTVAIGYLLAAGGEVRAAVLLHTLFGAGLVAAGGSALNQWLERRIDGRMQRTMKRPLPAGRLSPAEALVFGVGLSAGGLVYLVLTTPPAAAVAAAITLVSYVAVYTPLKTVTVWNTLVGAVPGALPPVIGWCAARGWENLGGASGLFLILFLWQVPHFLAIAWMYRDDYARGGLRMLPIADPSGGLTAGVMILTCAILIPASLLPVVLGGAGAVYAVAAVAFGVMFLWSAVRFGRTRTDRPARTVLRASLVYLPGVLGVLLIDALLRG